MFARFPVRQVRVNVNGALSNTLDFSYDNPVIDSISPQQQIDRAGASEDLPQ
jgi:hypothetical protein